jgi:hypothetical protein
MMHSLSVTVAFDEVECSGLKLGIQKQNQNFMKLGS